MNLYKNGILVVSSNPLIRSYLSTFLAHFGHKVHLPDIQEDPWERVTSIKPLLVVFDALSQGSQWSVGDIEGLLSRLDPRPAFLFLNGPMESQIKEFPWNGNGIAFARTPMEPNDLKEKVLHLLGEDQNGSKGVGPSDHHGTIFPQDDSQTTGMLVGMNRRFKVILDIIDRVAATDVTVLIRGESGTGKELVARRIHDQSGRRERPFIKVLCPAIPDPLLESELFGYEKGSFTGAFRRKPGRFEFANEGSIFLDEIGDISFSLQSKLLQVLQEGEFARLGGKEDIRVNVRIVAATNRDLERAVREGAFREDLFYRLNVVNIYMPPLRDRKDDIPILVRYFLDRFNQQFNKRVELSPGSMQLFLDYHWPGNVRELENTLKGMVILGNEREVMRQFQLKIELYRSQPLGQGSPGQAFPTPSGTKEQTSHVPREGFPVQERRRHDRRRNTTEGISPRSQAGDGSSLKNISREASRKAEEEMIKKVLEKTHWNRKEAAKILGISYKALLYKVKRFKKK